MDLEAAVRKHSEMLYRICIVILGSEQDTQDAIQETFCKYLEKKPKFVDGEHEKAWRTKWLCRSAFGTSLTAARSLSFKAVINFLESPAMVPPFPPLDSTVYFKYAVLHCPTLFKKSFFQNKKDLYLYLWENINRISNEIELKYYYKETSDFFEAMTQKVLARCEFMRTAPDEYLFSLRALYMPPSSAILDMDAFL